MSKLTINKRSIGSGQPAYVIAEIGFNHEGKVELGLEMIEAAATAGVDAVKFQTFKANRLTLESWEHFDLIKHGELDLAAHQLLAQRAKDLDLDFLSTPFCSDSLKLLEEVGVPAYKIASMDITNVPLLRDVAKTGKPVILSTGMATLHEIGDAVEVLQQAGCSDLALLHCISIYPPSPEDANLRTMEQIADAYGLPTGYSDHVVGNVASLAAVTLGACIIEKHFTTDKSLPGPDHAMSTDTGEMKELVESIRLIEKALGRRCADGTRPDRENAKVNRRGLYAATDLPAGTILDKNNVLCVRPENTLEPRAVDAILGRAVKSDLKAEDALSLDNL